MSPRRFPLLYEPLRAVTLNPPYIEEPPGELQENGKAQAPPQTYWEELVRKVLALIVSSLPGYSFFIIIV